MKIALEHVAGVVLFQEGFPAHARAHRPVVVVVGHGLVDRGEYVRLAADALRDVLAAGRRQIGREVDADERRDALRLPAGGGEATRPPKEWPISTALSHFSASSTAMTSLLMLRVCSRGWGSIGLAEAAHIHRHHRAVLAMSVEVSIQS